MSSTDVINWYQANALELAAKYESVSAEEVHGWLLANLPKKPSLVLDIGAGSGRDAGWLASLGHEVVAVEPCEAMRDAGERLHGGKRISWISDCLPGLEQTFRLGLSFDVILLSAVWMHVSPSDRERAFRKLVTLLRPGGLIALTLRHGPSEPERFIYDVSKDEIERFARERGAFVELINASADRLGRPDVSWTQMIVRLPDDGTGALPLLRHVILNDVKASTYKLALLRSVCRIADGSAGMARDVSDDRIGIPLGLVGLYWLRLFKPILDAGLPQAPGNIGLKGLGFVKEGYKALADVSHLDLRVGSRFFGQMAVALRKAVNDACFIIANMPARYTTYPNGGPIFQVKGQSKPPRTFEVVLNEDYLMGYGEMHVPSDIWRALQRFDAWIEPALVEEWIRLTKTYAEGQGRTLDEGGIRSAMAWSTPERDTVEVRRIACRFLSEKVALRCVWTGRELDADSLDIDHCFPWSRWPCNDLWNLLPAHRKVNQKKKHRLPGEQMLRGSRKRILQWWRDAYTNGLSERFMTEAQATLPSLACRKGEHALEDIFDAVIFQRLRLKHDQQLPEWDG